MSPDDNLRVALNGLSGIEMKTTARLKQDIDEQLQFYKSAVIWDISHGASFRDQANDKSFRDQQEALNAGNAWRGFPPPLSGFQVYHGTSNPQAMEAMKSDERNRMAAMTDTESVTAFWKQFAKDTTFHGVRRIENRDKSKCFRFTWLILVCCMAGGLTYTVANLLFEYYQYNTVTKSDIKVVTSIPFPSITLCNLCPFKNVDNTTDAPVNSYMRNMSILAQNFPLNDSSPDFLEFLNTTLEDFYNKYSFNSEETFYLIQYENQFFSVSDGFEVIDTIHGRCFTFNGPESIAKRGIVQATFDGRYAGLHVYFMLHQDQYFVHDDLTAGVRMFVSQHPETPRLLKDGIDIHPGTSTRVALRAVKYQFLPQPYESYGNEDCHETQVLDISNKMINSSFYSYEKCVEQCRLHMASLHCSCYTHLLYVPDLKKCTLGEFQFCFKGHFESVNSSSCDCPRPCTFTTYDIQMSASQMPSHKSAQLILDAVNETSVPKLRENYVDLRVFMGSMLVRTERHEPQYTFNSIFAFLGGQMGFFIGASLITMAELMETILHTLYLFLAKKFAQFKPVWAESTTKVQHLKAWT